MSDTLYSTGDVSLVTIVCRDQAGALADPDTLDVTIGLEGSAPTAYAWPATIARLSLGTFRLEHAITTGGEWLGRAVTTGSVTPAAKRFILYAR